MAPGAVAARSGGWFQPERGALARRLVLLLGLLASAAVPGFSHTRLQDSSPAAGDALQIPPEEIRLLFSTPVEPAYTTIRLIGPGGQKVTIGPLLPVEGSDRREFVAAVAALVGPGTYSLRWRTAGADGHAIEGEFHFLYEPQDEPAGVAGTPSVAAAPSQSSPPAAFSGAEGAPPAGSIAPIAVRWLRFAALLLFIGVVVVRALVLPRAAQRVPADFLGTLERRTRRLLFAAISGAAVAAVLRLWLQSSTLHGADEAWNADRLRTLAATGWGRAWILEATLLGLALVLAAVAARQERPARRDGPGDLVSPTAPVWWGLGVAAAALAAVPAFSGHAAAVAEFRTIAVVMDALHVLAAGGWLGSLLVLITGPVLLVLQRRYPHAAPALEGVLNAFSPIALICAGALAVSGALGAVLHLTATQDLVGTSYGRVLLVKLGLVMLVASLGLLNWRYVLPAIQQPGGVARLKVTATAELLLAAGVLLITAILVGLPTP